MKLDRRTFLKGSALTATVLGMSGCKRDLSKSNMVSMYLSNPVSIDPFNCQEDQGTQVATQLFNPLTKYDYVAATLVPCAATSWESDDEAKTFTFHLLEGATFHNGEEVNAEAFKRGWNRLVSPATNPDSPSSVSYHLSMVEGYSEVLSGDVSELAGLECPDEYTFVVHLSQSYADFPYVVSHIALSPMPEESLQSFDQFFRAPVGNGPFQMDGTWQDGQYINLVKYDKYVGDQPSVDAINFNIQKDVDTAYREFVAGNIDITDVPVAQIKEAEEAYGVSLDGYTMTPGHELLTGQEPSTYYITLNDTDETLKDPNLRTALSLGINREAICETIFMGTRTPATNIVPPGIDGFQEGAWTNSKYDRAAAKKILDKYYPADANGDRGIELTLSFNAEGAHKAIMEQVQADLKELGITVTLDQCEWAALLNRYDSGDYQMGRLGWVSDYPILDNFLYPLFYTNNGDNHANFSDPAIDKQLEAARQITNTEERIKALQEVNKEIGKQMPVIPLFFYNLSEVGSERIEYGYMNPQKVFNFTTLRLVQ